MQGSDAHEERTVGVPDGDRYSWIKGAQAFDTLRQACVDPAGRAYVGDEPPVVPLLRKSLRPSKLGMHHGRRRLSSQRLGNRHRRGEYAPSR